ncbi:MAG: hypothetical protein IKL75_05985 [Bacteroidaceae bacterium]|nr:hypothetical protein [Bacteroidaceae bacterium]
MNKIYSEPIAKAESLIEGVCNQTELLAKKGIVVDVDILRQACRALEEAGAAQDAAEAKLKEARDAAHECLEKLKEALVVSKTPIKQNFSPEVWLSFGLADKK